MADEKMIFDQEVAPSADAYGREGIGMAPANFVMPEGTLAAAWYGAAEAVPEEDVPAAPQPRPAVVDDEVVPFKVAWTREKDNMLKEMVRRYGEGKWAEIAVHLPDRTGKQCRERWTDREEVHDLMTMQNDLWTEHDDRVLIESHKIFGNRWSKIARYLPGRSDNAVKNHWNATKRSLMSKRRLKDKKKSPQAAPGQFTLLEEYIRSQSPATVTEPPAAPAPQPSFILGHYGGPGLIPYDTAQPAPRSNLPGMGMYVDNSGAGSWMNLNTLALPDLNAYGAAETQEPWYPIVPFECRPSYNLKYRGGELMQTMINGGDTQQAADTNLSMLFPFAENVKAGQLDWESYGGGYYSDAAGLSSAGGSSDPGDFDVVREFLTPFEDEVTLDLIRFK